MGSGQLVKCICNQTHGGDVCSHCGLPHSTARYLSLTGPLLPFFILAGMAAVLLIWIITTKGYGRPLEFLFLISFVLLLYLLLLITLIVNCLKIRHRGSAS